MAGALVFALFLRGMPRYASMSRMPSPRKADSASNVTLPRPDAGCGIRLQAVFPCGEHPPPDRWSAGPSRGPHTPPKRRNVSDRWPDEPVAHLCSALPCKQLFVLVCRDLQLFSRVFRQLLFQFQHMIHVAFQRFPAEGVSFQRHVAVGAALLRNAE